MSIEVTVFVPFTFESKETLINGTAEIYGTADDYDVVKLHDRKGNLIWEHHPVWKKIRDELIHEQYVFDTVAEAVSMEYDAR